MEDTTTAKDILERMRQKTGAKSDSELGRMLGVSQQAIYNARNSNKLPDAWVRKIAVRFSISTDWLFFGTSFVHTEEDQTAYPSADLLPTSSAQNQTLPKKSSTINKLEVIDCQDCEIVLVPMVEAVLSAGNGSFETGGMTDRRYAFRSDFLKRKGQASQMVLMRVSGDSMEPEIKDNDVVLIDQSNKRLLPNAIYAVAVEDMVYLKRVNALPGKLILTSFNELYAPIEVDTNGDLEDSVNIIGRVIWWCREA